MSYSFDHVMQTHSTSVPIVLLTSERRARFILRTYLHLLVAVLLFTLIELFFFQSGIDKPILQVLKGVPWLVTFSIFMLVGWFASRLVTHIQSLSAQYLTLMVFILVEAILFLPLLLIAEAQVPGVLPDAACITLSGVAGLTAIAFVMRKDFSFFGSMWLWIALTILLLIINGLLFGFERSTWFSATMITVAGGLILRDTSRIVRYYREDHYVAAAVELAASFALLFWYLLRLVLRRL